MSETISKLDLFCGSHQEEFNIVQNDALRHVDLLLQDPTVNVIYFAESAQTPQKISKDILEATQQGIPPTEATILAIERFRQIRDRDLVTPIIPHSVSDWSPLTVQQRRRYHLADKYDFFTKIDDIYFRTFQDTPRFFLTYESTDMNDNYEREMQRQTAGIMMSVDKGLYADVLARFKQSSKYSAEVSEKRDKGVAKDINRLSKRPNTVVVAAFGTQHSFIGHSVSRAGLPTQIHYSRINANSNYFNITPEDILIRKIRHKGFKHITDLEWHKGLIGHLSLLSMYKDLPDNTLIPELQKAHKKANDFAKSFTSVEEVKEFIQSKKISFGF